MIIHFPAGSSHPAGGSTIDRSLSQELREIGILDIYGFERLQRLLPSNASERALANEWSIETRWFESSNLQEPVCRAQFSYLPPRGDSDVLLGKLLVMDLQWFRGNSFEQLCINLANERLQQYFVESLANKTGEHNTIH